MRYISKNELANLINNTFSDNISLQKMQFWFKMHGYTVLEESDDIYESDETIDSNIEEEQKGDNDA